MRQTEIVNEGTEKLNESTKQPEDEAFNTHIASEITELKNDMEVIKNGFENINCSEKRIEDFFYRTAHLIREVQRSAQDSVQISSEKTEAGLKELQNEFQEKLAAAEQRNQQLQETVEDLKASNKTIDAKLDAVLDRLTTANVPNLQNMPSKPAQRTKFGVKKHRC